MTRDASVSISKAIAIILMVMAHARCPQMIQVFINMFHMPLFLFMSGYCFKEEYLDGTALYIKRRIKNVYWPFVKWGVFFLVLHNVFFHLNIYSAEYGFNGSVSHLYTGKEFFTHFYRIVLCMSDNEQLLGGYWFLKSLFVGSLLFFFTLKLVKKPVLAGAGLFLLPIVLIAFDLKVPFFGIGYRECLAAFFIWSGYEYKHLNLNLDQKWPMIPLGFVIVLAGTLFWPGSMLTNKWFTLPHYMFSALAGTLMIKGIGNIVARSTSLSRRFLDYTGNHTLGILTWHMISLKIVSLIIIAVFALDIKRLSEFPVIEEFAYKGWWILYLIVGVAIPLGVEYLLSHAWNRHRQL